MSLHIKNGLLVEPRDTDGLTEALRRLIADPALRLSLGRRGRERAVEEFSTGRINAEVLALYEDLVE